MSAKVVQLPSRAQVIVTKQQLARELDRSTRWIEQKIHEDLPVLEATDRFGRRQFDLEAVRAWMAGGRARKPVDRLGRLETEVAALRREVERLRRAG